MESYEEEDQIERLYFSVNEVSIILDIPASTVRFWTEFFNIPSKLSSNKRRRKYHKDDLDVLKDIKYLLKDEEYSMHGAYKKIKQKYPRLKSMREVIIAGE